MKRQPKQYEGSVYIGAVGSDTWVDPECRDSLASLVRRPGDTQIVWHRGTKGYEARDLHLNRWLKETQHPFALLLDSDEIYQEDTLERLRSHKLPYVSGYHLRRRYAPLAPLWYKLGPRGVWPLEPWTTDPERGKLHQLAGSGWGCILVHRDVAEAVRPLLKGEPFIIEDDMDVYPYDLAKVMGGIEGLKALVRDKPDVRTLRPALAAHVDALTAEIRPLRGAKSVIGSDLRFPFFAREAGYILMGDPDVRCKHMLNYPLDPDDFTGMPEETKKELQDHVSERLRIERKEIRQHLYNLKRVGL